MSAGHIPDYPGSIVYILKLTIAILGPVVVLGLVGAFVLIQMRRNYRKRIIAARIKADPEPYYTSDDYLRVTAAGDSTLRVGINKNTLVEF